MFYRFVGVKKKRNISTWSIKPVKSNINKNKMINKAQISTQYIGQNLIFWRNWPKTLWGYFSFLSLQPGKKKQYVDYVSWYLNTDNHKTYNHIALHNIVEGYSNIYNIEDVNIEAPK